MNEAVSRQAVLEQTYLWSKDEFLRVTNPFDYLRKRINSLPPVKQEQTGHWILHPEQRCRECSNCKVWMNIDMPRNSYCPNCGARMEEEDADSN